MINQKMKKLLTVLFVLAVSAVFCSTAMAAFSITSNASLTRGNGLSKNDFRPFTADSGKITIKSADSSASTTDFLVDTYIQVKAPSGLMFVRNDATGAAVSNGYVHVQNSNAEVDDFAAAVESTTANVSITAGTSSGLKTVTETYTDKDGVFRTAVVGFKLPITAASGSTNNTVVIDLNQVNGAGGIGLTPIPELNASPMNTSGLTFEVTANAGSSSAVTANVGSVNVLAAPKIISAELVGTNGVDLTFDVDINLTSTSVLQGTLEIRDTQAENAANTTNFILSKATASNDVTVSVDPTNKTLVQLRSFDSTFDTDGTDTINIATDACIQNALGSWPPTQSSLSLQEVSIVPAGIEVSSITADKTTIGVETTELTSTYDAYKKDDNTNKLSVTFSASGGAPFEWRIMNPSSGQKLSITQEATHASATLSDVKIDGTDNDDEYTDADGTQDLTFSSNVIGVPADLNTSGSVQFDLSLANIDDIIGLEDGKEGTIQIQASNDKFATKQTLDIKVDRKKPSVVLSGDNKAAALSRTQVKFQFNEEMDRTSVEKLYVNTNGDSDQDTGEPSVYVLDCTTDATCADVSVSSVSLASDNKTVTLTTGLMAVGKTYKVKILGSNGDPVSFGSDDSNRAGAMDLAGNYVTTGASATIETNTFIAGGGDLASVTATNATTKRDFVADSKTISVSATGDVNLTTVQFRAVDADNTSTILSTSSSVSASETSAGTYTATLTLKTGITASNVIIQAATESTFAAPVESNSLVVDNTKPKVVSAAWLADNSVQVVFDEPVLVAEAQATGSYSIAGLQVSKAELNLSDEKTVTLTTTNMTADTTYTVDVNSVQDLAGNAINTSANAVGTDRATYTEGTAGVSATPETLTITVGATGSVAISGGTAPYTATPTDETTATATVDEKTVTVTGVREGSTNLTIKDDEGNSTTVVVKVDAAPTGLAVTSDATSIDKDGTATLTIANGTAPFTLSASPADAVTGVPAEATEDTTVALTGAEVTADTAVTVTVTDADGATADVVITVNAPAVVEDPQPMPPAEGEDKPLEGDDPINEAPVSVGTVTDGKVLDELDLIFQIPPFEDTVDVYVVLAVANADGSVSYIGVNEDGSFATLSLTEAGSLDPTGLNAYATGIKDGKTATIFENFSICSPFGGGPSIPSLTVFYLVTPASDGDIVAGITAGYSMQYFTVEMGCSN